MIIFCTVGFIIGSAFFGELFGLVALGTNALIFLLVCAAATAIIFNVIYSINENLISKYKNKAKIKLRS
jgi:hypothetical protein